MILGMRDLSAAVKSRLLAELEEFLWGRRVAGPEQVSRSGGCLSMICGRFVDGFPGEATWG